MNRRTYLKTLGGTAGVITGGLTGTATASCPAEVAIITSDSFEDDWSGDTRSKKQSVRDFLDEEWHEDLGQAYAVDFQLESTVVSAYTPSYDDIRDRRNDVASAVVDSGLDPFNWDAILALDFGPWDGYGATGGFLGEPTGDGGNIVAVVNCSYEQNGTLPLRWERLESEGIAFHEIANNAAASDGSASLLELWDEAWYGTVCADIEVDESAPDSYCKDEGRDRNRPNIATLSDCNVQHIKDHMDSVDFCS